MKILVSCLGNTCRSPVIAALLQKALDESTVDATVESAGVIPDLLKSLNERAAHQKGAQPHSITIAAEQGCDITSHVPRHVTEIGDLNRFDFIFAAEPKVVTALMEVGVPETRIILLNAPDGVYNPYDATRSNLLDQDLGKYRRMAAEVEDIIPDVMDDHVWPLVTDLDITEDWD